MAQDQKQTTGSFVTVALKHPTGIIIQAQEEMAACEPVMGGGTRPYKVFRGVGRQYRLHGNATRFGEAPRCTIISGYALTPNVPKDVWDDWRQKHKDSPLIENSLIMAFESMGKAEGFAREGEDLRSGLEPLVPNTDPRIDKRRNLEGKIVPAVETANAA